MKYSSFFDAQDFGIYAHLYAQGLVQMLNLELFDVHTYMRRKGKVMGDIEKSIKWMEDHHRHKGNYPYSMVRRYGNPGFDCSSSIHYALIAGGFLPKTAFIGNTETLFALARQGKVLKEIYDYKDVQPGDIFIRGGEGTSLGAKGHTGMFYKKDGIIHSNYTNNGISKNDLSSYLTYYLDRKRSRNERYFRPIPQEESKPINKKSVSEVAKEVLAGKWGVGQDRVRKLENAGYSYKTVQDEVNRQLRNKPVYYVVKAGDSLGAIAKAYKVSLDKVIELNPHIKNPNLIYKGQKIRVK